MKGGMSGPWQLLPPHILASCFMLIMYHACAVLNHGHAGMRRAQRRSGPGRQVCGAAWQ